jgi:hypothetical protein
MRINRLRRPLVQAASHCRKQPMPMLHLRLPLLVACLLLGGCTSAPPGVGHEILDCCYRDMTSYRTFRLEVTAVPAFLAPFAEAALETALVDNGLRRAEPGDLSVHLTFDQVPLEQAVHADDFEGHIEPGGTARFVARLTFTIVDAATQQRLWVGRISRLHHVDPGEYMHTGRAAGALHDGFRAALAGFRDPLPERRP